MVNERILKLYTILIQATLAKLLGHLGPESGDLSQKKF